MTNKVIIVGASARAAAQSAARSGWEVVAADLFGDRDLRDIARSIKLPATGYPGNVVDRIADLPKQIPWMFTGGLENHPHLISALASQRCLLGNDKRTIRAVREPTNLVRLISGLDWRLPETTDSPRHLRSPLRKPIRHCGGMGVRRCTTRETPRRGIRYQEYVAGQSLAALFVGNGASARLLGVTKQVLARDVSDHPLHEQHPFAYVGSVGPVMLGPSDQRSFESLGKALAAGAGLVGLFGVDVVFADQLRQWNLVEVNPRFTASAELLERAFGWSAFDQHLLGCQRRELAPELSPRPRSPRGTYAKRIIYADGDMPITESFVAALEAKNKDDRPPRICDIPQAGQHIPSGRPVMTVFGHGTTPQQATDDVNRCINDVSAATLDGQEVN